MISGVVTFLTGRPADISAAEKEVEARRERALKAIAKRREKDPTFHVRNETISAPTADDETRALIRRLAGVD